MSGDNVSGTNWFDPYPEPIPESSDPYEFDEEPVSIIIMATPIYDELMERYKDDPSPVDTRRRCDGEDDDL